MIKGEVNKTNIDRIARIGEIKPKSDQKPRKKFEEFVDNIVSRIASEKTSTEPKPPTDPKTLSFLTPDGYLVERVNDQISYYVYTTRKLNRQFQKLHVVILLAGAAGTFLAAVGFPVWVALTTALATAWTTKLEIDQTENSLVQYNIALTSLRNIASWWNSLSPWERGRRRNIDLLVEQTEKTLEGELAGWVQQMQSSLEKLTEKDNKTSS